jgi:broad specificity phosphatase PhoE
MGTIYLIRHGQAAFGTDDYDRLTKMGINQCRHLGEYLAQRKVQIDAAFCGSLTRHRQSLEAVLEGYGHHGAVPVNQAGEIFPALNEYDPKAVVEAFNGERIAPHAAAEARDPQVVRQHFRLLRDALVAWADARTEPLGMPTFARFQSDAYDVLRVARERFTDGNVVIVSSGGPIGAIVAKTLESPAAIAVDLNLRIRNASLTEFATSSRRHHLVAFNGIAHLEDKPDCVTYA